MCWKKAQIVFAWLKACVDGALLPLSFSWDTHNMWFLLLCLCTYHYYHHYHNFFSLWLNHAVVWCLRLILRFLLHFVSFLQVPAIMMWFLSLESAVCAYLCLTWAGKVSTLDIFSLMCLPQGWLWNSWSSFIPVSLLSVQNMKTLIYWTAYFLKFKILGTGV